MSESKITSMLEPPPRIPHSKIDADELTIVDIPVSGLTLDLGVRKNLDGIGWGATLRNCVLRVHDPNGATVHNATLEDCHIVAARRKVEDISWRNVRFIRCSFEGIFRLCQLGFQSSEDKTYPAEIVGCDFSRARLDYCSIGNIEIASTKWPESPHMLFHQPDSHRTEIRSILTDFPLVSLLEIITGLDERCRVVAISQAYLEERKKTEKEKYSSMSIWPGDLKHDEQYERFLKACRKLDYVRINF